MPLEKSEKKEKRTGEGNNSISSPLQHTFYAVTLWYKDDNEKNEKISKCKFIAKKGSLGEEICPTTGSKHLQGFLCLNRKTRETAMWKLFPKDRCKPCFASEVSNLAYTTKDGNAIIWDNVSTNVPEAKIELVHNIKWNSWNTWIVEQVQQPADSRTINWFWSSRGKLGKTNLTRYLVDKHNAQFASGGKYTDIMNLIYHTDMDKCRCVIFTLPKEHRNHISYSALESVKDGLVSNMKSYKNGSKIFNPPHIFVFANYPPDLDGVMRDRWNIFQINYFDQVMK